MPVAQQGWVVYDVVKEEVIGKWDKYTDAMQFWGDVMNCDDIDWQVFPAQAKFLTVNEARRAVYQQLSSSVYFSQNHIGNFV